MDRVVAGPIPWAGLGYREEMRGPSWQERAEIQVACLWKEIKGRKLMFIEQLLCSSHCDMCWRDINRCGLSHERAKGLAGRQPCPGVPLTVI